MYIDVSDAMVGWNSIEQLITLGEIAKDVPENGWIIESSSYAGRASYVLASNKHRSATLTCFEIFSHEPTTPDPNCFGHTGRHVNFYTFKKQVVNKFENVEAVRADFPIMGKYIKFDRPVDMIYFNNDYDPEVFVERARIAGDLISDDGVIVINNVQWLEDTTLSVYGNNKYIVEYKHNLMVVRKNNI